MRGVVSSSSLSLLTMSSLLVLLIMSLSSSFSAACRASCSAAAEARILSAASCSADDGAGTPTVFQAFFFDLRKSAEAVPVVEDTVF